MEECSMRKIDSNEFPASGGRVEERPAPPSRCLRPAPARFSNGFPEYSLYFSSDKERVMKRILGVLFAIALVFAVGVRASFAAQELSGNGDIIVNVYDPAGALVNGATVNIYLPGSDGTLNTPNVQLIGLDGSTSVANPDDDMNNGATGQDGDVEFDYGTRTGFSSSNVSNNQTCGITVTAPGFVQGGNTSWSAAGTSRTGGGPYSFTGGTDAAPWKFQWVSGQTVVINVTLQYLVTINIVDQFGNPIPAALLADTPGSESMYYFYGGGFTAGYYPPYKTVDGKAFFGPAVTGATNAFPSAATNASLIIHIHGYLAGPQWVSSITFSSSTAASLSVASGLTYTLRLTGIQDELDTVLTMTSNTAIKQSDTASPRITTPDKDTSTAGVQSHYVYSASGIYIAAYDTGSGAFDDGIVVSQQGFVDTRITITSALTQGSINTAGPSLTTGTQMTVAIDTAPTDTYSGSNFENTTGMLFTLKVLGIQDQLGNALTMSSTNGTAFYPSSGQITNPYFNPTYSGTPVVAYIPYYDSALPSGHTTFNLTIHQHGYVNTVISNITLAPDWDPTTNALASNAIDTDNNGQITVAIDQSGAFTAEVENNTGMLFTVRIPAGANIVEAAVSGNDFTCPADYTAASFTIGSGGQLSLVASATSGGAVFFAIHDSNTTAYNTDPSSINDPIHATYPPASTDYIAFTTPPAGFCEVHSPTFNVHYGKQLDLHFDIADPGSNGPDARYASSLLDGPPLPYSLKLVGIQDEFDHVLDLNNTTFGLAAGSTTPTLNSSYIDTSVWPNVAYLAVSATGTGAGNTFTVYVTRRGFLRAAINNVYITPSISGGGQRTLAVDDETGGASSNWTADFENTTGCLFALILTDIDHERASDAGAPDLNINDGGGSSGIKQGPTDILADTSSPNFIIEDLQAGDNTSGTSYTDYWYYDAATARIFIAGYNGNTGAAGDYLNVSHPGFLVTQININSGIDPTSATQYTCAIGPASGNTWENTAGMPFALRITDIDHELEDNGIGAQPLTLADTHVTSNLTVSDNDAANNDLVLYTAYTFISPTTNQLYLAAVTNGTTDALKFSLPGFVDRTLPINTLLTPGTLTSPGSGAQRTGELDDAAGAVVNYLGSPFLYTIKVVGARSVTISGTQIAFTPGPASALGNTTFNETDLTVPGTINNYGTGGAGAGTFYWATNSGDGVYCAFGADGATGNLTLSLVGMIDSAVNITIDKTQQQTVDFDSTISSNFDGNEFDYALVFTHIGHELDFPAASTKPLSFDVDGDGNLDASLTFTPAGGLSVGATVYGSYGSYTNAVFMRAAGNGTLGVSRTGFCDVTVPSGGSIAVSNTSQHTLALDTNPGAANYVGNPMPFALKLIDIDHELGDDGATSWDLNIDDATYLALADDGAVLDIVDYADANAAVDDWYLVSGQQAYIAATGGGAGGALTVKYQGFVDTNIGITAVVGGAVAQATAEICDTAAPTATYSTAGGMQFNVVVDFIENELGDDFTLGAALGDSYTVGGGMVATLDSSAQPGYVRAGSGHMYLAVYGSSGYLQVSVPGFIDTRIDSGIAANPANGSAQRVAEIDDKTVDADEGTPGEAWNSSTGGMKYTLVIPLNAIQCELKGRGTGITFTAPGDYNVPSAGAAWVSGDTTGFVSGNVQNRANGFPFSQVNGGVVYIAAQVVTSANDTFRIAIAGMLYKDITFSLSTSYQQEIVANPSGALAGYSHPLYAPTTYTDLWETGILYRLRVLDIDHEVEDDGNFVSTPITMSQAALSAGTLAFTYSGGAAPTVNHAEVLGANHQAYLRFDGSPTTLTVSYNGFCDTSITINNPPLSGNQSTAEIYDVTPTGGATYATGGGMPFLLRLDNLEDQFANSIPIGDTATSTLWTSIYDTGAGSALALESTQSYAYSNSVLLIPADAATLALPLNVAVRHNGFQQSAAVVITNLNPAAAQQNFTALNGGSHVQLNYNVYLHGTMYTEADIATLWNSSGRASSMSTGGGLAFMPDAAIPAAAAGGYYFDGTNVYMAVDNTTTGFVTVQHPGYLDCNITGVAANWTAQRDIAVDYNITNHYAAFAENGNGLQYTFIVPVGALQCELVGRTGASGITFGCPADYTQSNFSLNAGAGLSAVLYGTEATNNGGVVYLPIGGNGDNGQVRIDISGMRYKDIAITVDSSNQQQIVANPSGGLGGYSHPVYSPTTYTNLWETGIQYPLILWDLDHQFEKNANYWSQDNLHMDPADVTAGRLAITGVGGVTLTSYEIYNQHAWMRVSGGGTAGTDYLRVTREGFVRKDISIATAIDRSKVNYAEIYDGAGAKDCPYTLDYFVNTGMLFAWRLTTLEDQLGNSIPIVSGNAADGASGIYTTVWFSGNDITNNATTILGTTGSRMFYVYGSDGYLYIAPTTSAAAGVTVRHEGYIESSPATAFTVSNTAVTDLIFDLAAGNGPALSYNAQFLVNNGIPTELDSGMAADTVSWRTAAPASSLTLNSGSFVSASMLPAAFSGGYYYDSATNLVYLALPSTFNAAVVLHQPGFLDASVPAAGTFSPNWTTITTLAVDSALTNRYAATVENTNGIIYSVRVVTDGATYGVCTEEYTSTGTFNLFTPAAAPANGEQYNQQYFTTTGDLSLMQSNMSPTGTVYLAVYDADPSTTAGGIVAGHYDSGLTTKYFAGFTATTATTDVDPTVASNYNLVYMDTPPGTLTNEIDGPGLKFAARLAKVTDELGNDITIDANISVSVAGAGALLPALAFPTWSAAWTGAVGPIGDGAVAGTNHYYLPLLNAPGFPCTIQVSRPGFVVTPIYNVDVTVSNWTTQRVLGIEHGAAAGTYNHQNDYGMPYNAVLVGVQDILGNDLPISSLTFSAGVTYATGYSAPVFGTPSDHGQMNSAGTYYSYGAAAQTYINGRTVAFLALDPTAAPFNITVRRDGYLDTTVNNVTLNTTNYYGQTWFAIDKAGTIPDRAAPHSANIENTTGMSHNTYIQLYKNDNPDVLLDETLTPALSTFMNKYNLAFDNDANPANGYMGYGDNPSNIITIYYDSATGRFYIANANSSPATHIDIVPDPTSAHGGLDFSQYLYSASLSNSGNNYTLPAPNYTTAVSQNIVLDPRIVGVAVDHTAAASTPDALDDDNYDRATGGTGSDGTVDMLTGQSYTCVVSFTDAWGSAIDGNSGIDAYAKINFKLTEALGGTSPLGTHITGAANVTGYTGETVSGSSENATVELSGNVYLNLTAGNPAFTVYEGSTTLARTAPDDTVDINVEIGNPTNPAGASSYPAHSLSFAAATSLVTQWNYQVVPNLPEVEIFVLKSEPVTGAGGAVDIGKPYLDNGYYDGTSSSYPDGPTWTGVDPNPNNPDQISYYTNTSDVNVSADYRVIWVMARLWDSIGNPVLVLPGVNVSWTVSDHEASTSPNNGNTQISLNGASYGTTAYTTYNSHGWAWVPFVVSTSAGDDFVVTASITYLGVTRTDSSPVIKVVPGAAKYFKIVDSAPYTAGVAATITSITAYDSYGNVARFFDSTNIGSLTVGTTSGSNVNWWSGTAIGDSPNGSSATVPTSLTFANGAVTAVPFTFVNAGSSRTLALTADLPASGAVDYDEFVRASDNKVQTDNDTTNNGSSWTWDAASFTINPNPTANSLSFVSPAFTSDYLVDLDSATTVTIQAQVLDAYGNAIPGVNVTFNVDDSLDGGTVSIFDSWTENSGTADDGIVTTDSTGTATVVLNVNTSGAWDTAPPNNNRGAITLSANGGAITATTAPQGVKLQAGSAPSDDPAQPAYTFDNRAAWITTGNGYNSGSGDGSSAANAADVTNGTGFTVRITMRDKYGNIANFNGNKTVTITWSPSNPDAPDGSATALTSVNATFTNGVADITLYSYHSGDYSFTVSSSTPSAPFHIHSVPGDPKTATFAPTSITVVAGEDFDFSTDVVATLYDDWGNKCTNYTGNTTLTFVAPGQPSNSPNGDVPDTTGTVAFTNGDSTGGAFFTVYKVETVTLNVSITNGGWTATGSFNLTVTPAAVASYAVDIPAASVNAGDYFTVNIKCYDAYGNENATGRPAGTLVVDNACGAYGGTLNNGTSSGTVAIPAGDGNYTFTQIWYTRTGTLTLNLSGLTPYTADSVTVNPGALDYWLVDNAPTTDVAAGSNFTVNVSPVDKFGNKIATLATGISVTLSVVAVDGSPDSTLGGTTTAVITSDDTAFTVNYTAKEQIKIHASGGGYSKSDGDSPAINIIGGSLDHYEVTAPAGPYTTDDTFTVTITPEDAYGNITDGDNNVNISFTLVSGTSGTLSGTTTVDTSNCNATDTGVTADLSYNRPAVIKITCSDGSATGSAATNTTVTSGAPATITLNSLSSTTPRANGTVTFSVLVQDAAGNNVADGTAVNFTWTDPDAAANPNVGSPGGFTSVSTTTGGIATAVFQVSTYAGTSAATADNFKLTAAAGTASYTSATITVYPQNTIASFSLAFSTYSPTAGQAVTATIVAYDTYGNKMWDYNQNGKSLTWSGPSSSPNGTAFNAPSTADFANGQATVTVYFYDAETTTVTVSGSGSGTSLPVTVSPSATVGSLTLSGYPTSWTMNSNFNITVTPYDAYGNVVTTATANPCTLSVTGVNPATPNGSLSGTTSQTLSGATTYTNIKYSGTGTIKITATLGSVTASTTNMVFSSSNVVAALDLSITGYTGRNAALSYNAGEVEAGGSVTVKVTAYANAAKTIRVASGTPVTFTWTDWDAVANGAAPGGFSSGVVNVDSNGEATVTFTPSTMAGDNFKITASSGGTTQDLGTEIKVLANSQTVGSYTVTAPATATAGTAFNVTVKAYDAYGNFMSRYTAAGVTITVSGLSNSPNGTAPTYPTSASFTNGVATISVTGYASESAALTVTNTAASVTGTSGTINISAGSVASYILSGYPTSWPKLTNFNVTATAYDSWGNVTTGGNSVSLSAVLTNTTTAETNVTLSGGTSINMSGATTGTFQNVQITTTAGTTLPRTFDLYASDGTAASVPSSTNNITVTATSTVGSVSITAPAAAVNVAAGSSIQISATVLDNSNQPVAANTPVAWSWTPGGTNAAIPLGFSTSVTYTNANGVATVMFTPSTHAGDTFTITASSGGVNSSASPTITVVHSYAVGSYTVVPSTTTPVAGTEFTLTVTAYDIFGNQMNAYSNNRNLSFSGPSAGPDGTLPTFAATSGGASTSTYPFVNGVATVYVTLTKVESLTITVTDQSVPVVVVTGSTPSLYVTAGDVDHYTVTSIDTTWVVYDTTNITVAAYDEYGNPTDKYSGVSGGTTVHIKAVEPNDSSTDASYSLGGTTSMALAAVMQFTGIYYPDIDDIDIYVYSNAGAEHSNVSSTPNVSVSATTVVGYIEVIDPSAAQDIKADETYTVKVKVWDKPPAVTPRHAVAPGVVVNWSLTPSSGGASLSNASSLTDSSGFATTIFTPSTNAGDTFTITAANGSITATTPTFTVVAADEMGSLTVTLVGGNPTAGTAFTLHVKAYDKYGNFMNTYNSPAGGESITVTGASNPSGSADYSLPTTISFANGEANISVTLTETASVALTVTMTDDTTVYGTTAAFTVNPAAVDYLTVTGFNTSQTVGVPFSVVVTPYDKYGNLTTGGNVTLTGVAPNGVGTVHGNLYVNGTTNAPTASLASGAVTINNIIYTYPETVDIQATVGTKVNNINTTNDVTFARTTVVASITVDDPTAAVNVQAGNTYIVKVTAKDAYGNTVAPGTIINWSVNGAVGNTGAGSLATTTSATNASGQAAIVFTPSTHAGDSFTVTASNGTVTATSADINVIPNATLAAVQIVAPATATAGTAFNITATAYDAYNNFINTYSGVVSISVTGADASPNGTAPTLPTTLDFSVTSNGTATASVTLVKAVNTTLVITATGISVNGPSDISVSPAAVADYVLSGYPTSHTTNELFNLTITPKDAYGNVTGSDGKTLTISTKSPSQGGTPAGPERTLVGGGNIGPLTGATTISNLKYTGVGYVDLYVEDSGAPAVHSDVNATADVYFEATTVVGSITIELWDGSAWSAAAQNLRAGDSIQVRARLLDANNNPVKTGQSVTWSYTRVSGNSANGAIGASPFSSATTSDADGYLTVLFTPSTTAGDVFTVSALNNVTGVSPNINVIPDDVPDSFTFTTATNPATAGVAFDVTIKVYDQYGNFMSDFNDTLNLAFTGPSNAPDGTAPVWPANPVAFVNGQTSGAQITLYCAETTDITVALSTDSTVNGTLSSLTVNPNAVDYYTVAAPASAVAHSPFNVTVTPYDEWNNPTTGDAAVTLVAHLPNGAVGAPDGTLTGTTTVDTSAGAATVSVVYDRVDTIDIYAYDAAGNTSDDNATQDTSFSPNVPAYIEIASLNATYPAGAAVTVTATVLDAVNGNRVADGTPITWTFTGETADAGFGNPAQASVTTTTVNGETTVVFHPNTTAGLTYTVTASWNAVSGTSTPFEIVPAGTDHFTVEVPDAEQTAGVPFQITVTAYDAYDNVNDLLDGDEAVAYSGPSNADVVGTAPDFPAVTTFTDGVATVTVTLYKAETAYITATFGTATGTSDGVTVAAADLAFYRVAYDLDPAVVEENHEFGVTVWGVDSWYNERPGASSVQILAEPVAGSLLGTLSSATVPSLIVATADGRAELTDLVYSEAQDIYIVAVDGNGIRSDNAVTGVLNVVDTVPPEVVSITTFGDGDGNISRARVVFDEIIVVQPGFVPSSFSIDGIVATSHTLVDAFTLDLFFGNPVPGTEPKDVVYNAQAPAGLTDTVGNPLASFTVSAIDQAEPVLLGYTYADTNANGYLNTVTFNYSEPLDASSATLAGWKIFDHDGVTDLLAGLTDADVAVAGASLVFTLADNSGTTGAPYYMYDGDSVKDPAGNLAAGESINADPVVEAGADQLDLLPTLVFLSATATDANQPADSLTYLWTLESGPADVEIVNADSPNARVLLTADGSYVFRITVTDVFGAEATDTLTVGIVNVAPHADAGEMLFINRTLTPTAVLDGTGTFDPNGDTITYDWTGDASLNLTGADTATPGIAPTVDGVFIVTLTVTDDDGAVSTDTVTVVVSSEDETVPFADAGKFQHSVVGNTVLLDGRGSYDADGDTMTFTWTQISGAPVTINDANTVLASFVPAVPGWYEFRLDVFDGTVAGVPSTVKVLVVSDGDNNAPVADAGLDQTVEFGNNVTLDGTNSSDVDGDNLTFQWTVLRGYAVLDDPTSPTPVFTPVRPGTYVFQLVVSDGINSSMPDTVVVNVVADGNIPPVAGAGYERPESGLFLPVTVQLTNTSYDANGDSLKYRWVQIGGPIVSFNATDAAPTFTPIAAGVYRFRLIVSDGFNVDTTEVAVPVNSGTTRVPVARAMPDRAFHIDTPAYVKGSGGISRNGFLWVQVAGPTLLRIEENYRSAIRFTPVALGSYTFALYTYNGYHWSLADYVTIQVVSKDTPIPGGGGGGGCFIATAAFGSLSAESVTALTDVRDKTLASSGLTSSLVSLYYAASPAVAEDLAGHDALRALIRSMLGR